MNAQDQAGVRGRILGVDPGEKNIGVAVSDPTSTIAGPVGTIKHLSRTIDAATVAGMAEEWGVIRIIIGQALGANGEKTPQARKAERFAEALREQTNIPVEMWDESGSTQTAQEARRAMQVSRQKRSGHLDDLAAVVILQSYLDAHWPSKIAGEVK